MTEQSRFEIDVAACRASPAARTIKAIHVDMLARSIAEIGLLQPIAVRAVDGSFEVIAGLHRLRAFEQLGRAQIPAIVRHDDDLHAELALIDENLIRNELSPIERDIAIARRKAIYAVLHPETLPGATGKGRPKVRQVGEANEPAERFSKATAEATGQGERTIQRSISRVETIGEENMAKLVETPLNNGVELDALANLPEAKRAHVIERALAGEQVSAKVELSKSRRADRESDLGARIAALPDKRYGLIYADIPRHFNVHSDDTGLGRSPENHYPTLSFEQTCALPIAEIAADDCVLVFWSTAASLIDDIDIMAEWGFVALRPRGPDGKLVRDPETLLLHQASGKYCSMQVWDKIRIGLGYWFRDRHEFILIGTRGNVVPPAQGTQDQSLFSELKGEHSDKPDHVAEMIERLWPTTPKIELFRRGAARPGWDVWGNEALPAPAIASPAAQMIAPPSPQPPLSPEPLSSIKPDDDLGIPDFLRRQKEPARP